jgi:hypothetical protein
VLRFSLPKVGEVAVGGGSAPPDAASVPVLA